MSKIEDLAAMIGRRATLEGRNETAVPLLDFFRRTTPTEWGPAVYEPALFVVAQGHKVLRLGDVTYEYDPAHCLVASVDLPVMCRLTKASAKTPYLSLRLQIDPVIVGELVAESAAEPSASVRGLVVSPVEPALLDSVARLVTLLDTPDDIAVLSPLLVREITYRILTGAQGPRLRQIASSGAPGQRVARAISWIKGHAAEPLAIDALARRVGMGLSAFHLHFKNVTGMSPLQFQKRLRLQEARRLMVATGLTAGEAAFRVGYESPSQFSREYHRAFGAPPRQDVVALRADVESASSVD